MSNDGFESVKGSGAIWEPKQTGSKKTKDLTPLQAGEDSWIIGHYLGTKEVTGQNNNVSNLHELKVTNMGNKAHIQGDLDPKILKIGIWGSGVLDTMIAESVQPGQLIKIVWLGKKQPKNAGGNEYHDWDVLVNNSVEPINVNASESPLPMDNNPIPPNAQPVAGNVPADGASIMEDDDDLPF